MGILDSFAELDGLRIKYNLQRIVIDSAPDTMQAIAYARQHPREVRLARYVQKNVHSRAEEGGVRYFVLGRTLVIDETFERFRKKLAPLPINARDLGGRLRDGRAEYYRHLMAQNRIVLRDALNDWEARWTDGGKDDHFAHAEVYAAAGQTVRPPGSLATALRT